MQTPKSLLKQYWGYDAFRPLQEDIVMAVVEGKEVLALLPTGGGKSVCFQVPGMLMEGVCIVISPLIALMKDQVEQLQHRGISAQALYSGMSPRQIDIALDNCVFGQVKFLYVSPERLKTELFIERFKRMKVSFIAVDEAHCISQWGYDFRPPYLEIASLRQWKPQVKIMALTASATPEVRNDIMEKLQMQSPMLFQKSFARANLSYSVRTVEDKMIKLLQILRSVQGSAVVYVRSRKMTQETAYFLQRNKISADFYHAGLAHTQRNIRQEAWIQGRTRVIVATNAFGMGIDKPNVRVVVHLDLPESLEAYYQEAGRAGRDEKKAYAVVLVYPHDTQELTERVLEMYPSEEFLTAAYRALGNYYQLAIGTAEGESYDFDLVAFASRFDFPPSKTYHALSRLAEQGFIHLSESLYRPSTVFIKVDSQKLYDLQLKQPTLDAFVKALLRLYGGEMYSFPTRISEGKVAQFLKVTEDEVRKMLLALHKGGIVEYLEQKESAQVTFLIPRLDAAKLPINRKLIDDSRNKNLKRVEAMVEYIKHPTRCRTQLILSYFGEDNYESCGVCDHCLEKKKQMETHDIERFRALIKTMLREGALPVEDLMEHFPHGKEEILLEVIRNLVDEGIVRYDEKWRLQLHLGE
jgi:ATP-dependent DNA helicase RecQ